MISRTVITLQRETRGVAPVTDRQRVRRRGRKSEPASAASTVVVAPPRGGAYRPLAPEDRDAIIEAAFGMLERVGMADAPAPFDALLVDAGATRRNDGRLCFSRAMVEGV